MSPTEEGPRPRARAAGLELPGVPGLLNAITDVPGVEVGYATVIRGDDVRTGVTAIHPRGRDRTPDAVAAGWFSLNGNGEMTGTTAISEFGAMAVPVMITNTHAVGTCHRAVVDWVLARHPALGEVWLLPVVAETWDGRLNDVNGDHVTREHAVAALEDARSGPVAEGAVGGGTGMVCYGFKGGSGTSSRRVAYGDETYTVGVFVQANFGAAGELAVCGVPVGAALAGPADALAGAPAGAGSVIVVVATDAPLLPGQCTALARRVSLGLARTGTIGHQSSGDIFLAFSTGNAGALSAAPCGSLTFVSWKRIDVLYRAVVEATEEAVLNALFAGEDMVGRSGNRVPALPVREVVDLVRQRGR